jgi:hypothetical protein
MKTLPLDSGDEDDDGSKKDQRLGNRHTVHRKRNPAIRSGTRESSASGPLSVDSKARSEKVVTGFRFRSCTIDLQRSGDLQRWHDFGFDIAESLSIGPGKGL